MKNNRLNTHKLYGWKTAQFFINSEGVCEVQISHDSELRCSCIGFKQRKKCRHENWCKTQLRGGLYPIEITHPVPTDILEQAKVSPTIFRDIIIKYGKPLVL